MGAFIHAEYPVESRDYTRAGEASADIKRKLKQLGVSSMVLRRVAVATYEVELNLVIHSSGGKLILEVDEKGVCLTSQDIGPGIPNVEMAMREGYSTADDEARAMGFGAGMGLPNMKRNADEFEITDSLGNLISSYSHGMKQKIAIIAALVHNPKVLIMDEPFVGLDPKATLILKNIMKDICSKGGAIFFSTHVLDVAERICNKVAIIKDGKIVASGKMDELIKPGASLEDVFMEVVKDA